MDSEDRSVAACANYLGVQPSTVYRTIANFGVEVRHQRLDDARWAHLVAKFGAVPKIPGYRRSEILLIAALSRSPLGLRSLRAIARRSSLSPTGVTSLLPQLIDAGLVLVEHREFLEGRATQGTLWRLNLASPEWQRIASIVGKVVLPEAPQLSVARRVPARFGHHFWTGSLYELDLVRDGAYIASRLVLSDDPQAISWATSHLDAKSLHQCSRARGLAASQRTLLEGAAIDAATGNQARRS